MLCTQNEAVDAMAAKIRFNQQLTMGKKSKKKKLRDGADRAPSKEKNKLELAMFGTNETARQRKRNEDAHRRMVMRAHEGGSKNT